MKEGLVRIADPLQSPLLTVIFLLLIVLLAWCNVRSPQRLRAILRATFLMRPPRQLFRDDIDMQDRLVFMLLALALVSISVFIYQVGVIKGILSPERIVLLVIFALVLLATMLSAIVIRITGWLFNSSEGLVLYLNHSILQIIFLGVILVPLTLFITFSSLPREMLVIVGVVLLIFVVFLRWVRGFSVAIGTGVPVVYIVLYLCAAEILPALVGLRLLGLSPLT